MKYELSREACPNHASTATTAWHSADKKKTFFLCEENEGGLVNCVLFVYIQSHIYVSMYICICVSVQYTSSLTPHILVALGLIYQQLKAFYARISMCVCMYAHRCWHRGWQCCGLVSAAGTKVQLALQAQGFSWCCRHKVQLAQKCSQCCMHRGWQCSGEITLDGYSSVHNKKWYSQCCMNRALVSAAGTEVQ